MTGDFKELHPGTLSVAFGPAQLLMELKWCDPPRSGAGSGKPHCDRSTPAQDLNPSSATAMGILPLNFRSVEDRFCAVSVNTV